MILKVHQYWINFQNSSRRSFPRASLVDSKEMNLLNNCLWFQVVTVDEAKDIGEGR